MSKRQPLNTNEKNLTRRYLIWFYKTTKEDLDRIDRYFTQEKADHFVLDELRKSKDYQANREGQYARMVDEFEKYMEKKITSAKVKKYFNTTKEVLNPEYVYLENRLQAVEKAIVHFLGQPDLKRIVDSYEEEMTHRILTAREHT